ncbi:MAG: hypothetical protein NC300_01305 [Bacteroidales bacterium]|nr:hypothetical protein [Clostridium sp.]MCM1202762.1 hypothetical protein [Bacteroidales bacterium]
MGETLNYQQIDVQTALKVSNHILDTIERLEQFPDSGSAAPDDWLNEQGYRMVKMITFSAIQGYLPRLLF